MRGLIRVWDGWLAHSRQPTGLTTPVRYWLRRRCKSNSADDLPAERDDEKAPQEGAKQRFGDQRQVHPAVRGTADVAEAGSERGDTRERADHDAVERSLFGTVERRNLDVE